MIYYYVFNILQLAISSELFKLNLKLLYIANCIEGNALKYNSVANKNNIVIN